MAAKCRSKLTGVAGKVTKSVWQKFEVMQLGRPEDEPTVWVGTPEDHHEASSTSAQLVDNNGDGEEPDSTTGDIVGSGDEVYNPPTDHSGPSEGDMHRLQNVARSNFKVRGFRERMWDGLREYWVAFPFTAPDFAADNRLLKCLLVMTLAVLIPFLYQVYVEPFEKACRASYNSENGADLQETSDVWRELAFRNEELEAKQRHMDAVFEFQRLQMKYNETKLKEEISLQKAQLQLKQVQVEKDAEVQRKRLEVEHNTTEARLRQELEMHKVRMEEEAKTKRARLQNYKDIIQKLTEPKMVTTTVNESSPGWWGYRFNYKETKREVIPITEMKDVRFVREMESNTKSQPTPADEEEEAEYKK